MSFFLSQFKQPKVEDFDVYVPLGQAQRHASVVAVHEKGLGVDPAEAPDLKAIEAGEDGDASCLNRICGLCAPIVAVHAGSVNPNAPVFASGALILAAFVAMCCFPIETRGKQSL